MYEVAKVQGYLVDQDGTHFHVVIPNKNLQELILTKGMHQLGIWLDDGRHISAEQRKKIYATIADISRHTGYLPEELKEWLKYLHISKTGSHYFSLSNCSMDTAREFINTIMDYALENGIILTDLGINRTDDINRYLYACIKNKKCAVCGKVGEIHHWDAIGMGNARTKFDDSLKRKICLCREHHTEAHKIGNAEFEKKHKVYGIQVNT